MVLAFWKKNGGVNGILSHFQTQYQTLTESELHILLKITEDAKKKKKEKNVNVSCPFAT